MFSILFQIPDASTTLNGLGGYSLPLFSELLPLVYLVGGIFLAIGVVVYLIHVFTNFHK